MIVFVLFWFFISDYQTKDPQIKRCSYQDNVDDSESIFTTQKHFCLIQQTISNLATQITHLQSANVNLLKTISSLQSTINDANSSHLTSNLQSITSKLIQALSSSNPNESNLSSIKSYTTSTSKNSEFANFFSKSTAKKLKV